MQPPQLGLGVLPGGPGAAAGEWAVGFNRLFRWVVHETPAPHRGWRSLSPFSRATNPPGMAVCP